jgi:DNA-binding PadR family transcriptional regulator
MAKENKTQYAILGLLAIKPASGYDLKLMIHNSTAHFWGEGDSSIYPTLKKLNADGLISCEEDNVVPGKPRKVYSITSQGEDVLKEWLVLSPDKSKRRNELLLKIYFGWNVPTSVCLHHLNMTLAKSKEALSHYQRLHASKPKGTRQQIFQSLTLRSGVLFMQATIQWCEEAVVILDKL